MFKNAKGGANKSKKTIIIDGKTLNNETSSGSIYLLGLLHGLTNIYTDTKYILIINSKKAYKQLKGLSDEIDIKLNEKMKNPVLWNNFLIPYYALRYSADIIFYPKSVSCLLKPKNKKVISTIHGLIYKIEPQNQSWIENIYGKLAAKIAFFVADKIVVVSNNDKNDLIKYGCNPKKIIVIPIGINDSFFKNYKKTQKQKVLNKYNLNSKKYFIQVGHITPKKNQKFTADILSNILLQDEYKLVFVGSKEKNINFYKELLFFIKSKNIKDKIIFTGTISQRESNILQILLQESILSLFPSTYEGFGIPAIESIASGVPVLVSDRGALKEIFKIENTLSLENKSLWKKEVNKLMEDKSYYNKAISKQKMIAKRYKWNNISRDYIKLFNEFLK